MVDQTTFLFFLPGIKEQVIKAGLNDTFTPLLVLVRSVKLLTEDMLIKFAVG